MALRIVKGKLRPESPRLKDVGQATACQPTEGRSADGRFAGGNGAANGRAAKALVRESLGSEGADPAIVKQALTMYRALLRDLPSDGPSVRQLVAARCRHAVMATCYANEASKAGLATPTGIKLAEQSRAHDLAAQRLAVTSYDLAIRGAQHEADQPIDVAAVNAQAERETEQRREHERRARAEAEGDEPA